MLYLIYEPKSMSVHGLPGQITQAELPLGPPGLDMDQAMIAPRENRAEPNRRHATESETLSVAVGWKVGIK